MGDHREELLLKRDQLFVFLVHFREFFPLLPVFDKQAAAFERAADREPQPGRLDGLDQAVVESDFDDLAHALHRGVERHSQGVDHQNDADIRVHLAHLLGQFSARMLGVGDGGSDDGDVHLVALHDLQAFLDVYAGGDFVAFADQRGRLLNQHGLEIIDEQDASADGPRQHLAAGQKRDGVLGEVSGQKRRPR